MTGRRANGGQKGILHLADIPFAETLPSEPAMPPFSDLFSKEADTALNARRRWLRYPLEGTVNTVFHGLLSALPAALVHRLGRHTADLARKRYRGRIFAERIERNFKALSLRRVASPEEQQAGLIRWWRNIGCTLAEFAKANALWREGHITVQGRERLDLAKQNGAPIIFVSMHLGTWEAAFTAIHEGLAGPSIGPFQPEPNPFTNRIVHRLRKKRRQYLFPPGQKTAIRLRKLLCSGEASLTIFIDEVRERQVHMPLFGRALPARGNAVVAVKLANACGGTIVPFFLKRKEGTTFDLILLPPLPRGKACQETAPSSYPLQDTLRALNDIFEPLVLQNLEHWYMLGELRLPKSFEEDTARAGSSASAGKGHAEKL